MLIGGGVLLWIGWRCRYAVTMNLRHGWLLVASLLYGLLPSLLAFRANLSRSWGKARGATQAAASS